MTEKGAPEGGALFDFMDAAGKKCFGAAHRDIHKPGLV